MDRKTKKKQSEILIPQNLSLAVAAGVSRRISSAYSALLAPQS